MGMILTAPGMKTHQFTYIHNSMFLVKLAEAFDKRYGELQMKCWKLQRGESSRRMG